jgi:glycosyl transferase family 1
VIRRILMATLNYDHPQNGMIAAFKGMFGKDSVYHYDYLQRIRDGVDAIHVNGELRQAAIDFQPDWAWLQLQNTGVITVDTVRAIRSSCPRCVVSHWSGDVRPSVGDYFASICSASHITFAANVGQLPMYLAAGAPRVAYLAHGLDWTEDVLGLPDWEPPFRVPQVVFIGNHYGDSLPGAAEREAAVRCLVQSGMDVGVVGNGWQATGLPVAGRCHVKQQHHVWKRATVALSVNHFPGLAGYHGDRQIIAMASGTPVVARAFPMMGDEFSEGISMLSYRDEAECVERVSQLIEDTKLRHHIGSHGRAEVIRRHTWFSRVAEAMVEVERVASRL